MRRRLILTLGAALPGLAPLLASGPAGAVSDTLRVAMNSDIRGTDPFGNRDQNTDAVLQQCIEGLVALRENAEIAPMLAESWEVSVDGRTYTFRLRGGVRFHNGAVLSSADVAYSWHRLLDPASLWRGRSDFDGKGAAGATRVMNISTPDARTVVFTLDRPSALFLVNMARPDYGAAAILHRDSWGADGKWVKPIGTGPFMFGEWRPGQSIALPRFPDYAALPGPIDGFAGGKRALVGRVLVTIIPDADAAVLALKSGAVDVIWPVSPTSVAMLKGDPAVRMQFTPVLDLYAVLLQTQDSLLKDVRVRRALAMSLDARQLAAGATEGLATPNSSAIAATSPYHTAVEDKGWPYDPAAARRLLAAAGYRGQPITLLANKQYPTMYAAAVLVQAMAASSGFNLRIEVLDWATQLDRYLHGAYQAMTFGYSPRLDPSQMFDAFVGPKATEPRKVWDDPRAEALLRQSTLTLDHAKRQAAFDALHRLLLEDVPLIPLFNNTEISATRSDVVGFKGWPGADPRFWDVRVG